MSLQATIASLPRTVPIENGTALPPRAVSTTTLPSFHIDRVCRALVELALELQEQEREQVPTKAK